MKMKRFFAPDIRQAIRKVRDELGPDAVILSNRRVEGGVEIVSAIDYDEAMVSNADLFFTAPDVPRVSNQFQPAVEPHRGTTGKQSSVAQPAQSQKSFYETTAALSSDQDDEDEAVSLDYMPGQILEESHKTDRKDGVISTAAPKPALNEMWAELRNLRGLLENQLSGLAWGDLTRRYPQQAELFQRLMRLGLSATLCRQVVDEIPLEITQAPQFELLWRRALGVLAHQVQVTDDDILTQGGIVALVGPTGVGKTTTVAKLAAHYALRHGSRHVALVTTDNYRIGAHEHLKSYGRILNIPVRVASDKAELQQILAELSDRRLILIDTAGMGQRDVRLSAQFAVLNGSGGRTPRIKTYLVLSTTTRLSGMDETIRAFQGMTIDGCIFTKLDEATSLGSALSVAIQHDLPVAYISDGQRVPEDLHNARAHTLVSRSVAIMQQAASSLEDEALLVPVEKVARHVHV
ncbi:MAG: flagellar biosynthesis protein FlhF [Gammaproteobacteria bacterium]|jgi:flagellar biosynthesis protein FlhF|nr:flagellar biosynthesis protein FlhF [Gammaproteobacteria bacterium]